MCADGADTGLIPIARLPAFPALKLGFIRASPRAGLVEGRSWAGPTCHGAPAQHHPRDGGPPPPRSSEAFTRAPRWAQSSVRPLTPFCPPGPSVTAWGRPRPVGTWATRSRCWAALMRLWSAASGIWTLPRSRGTRWAGSAGLGPRLGPGPQTTPPRALGAPRWEEDRGRPPSETRALLAHAAAVRRSPGPPSSMAAPLSPTSLLNPPTVPSLLGQGATGVGVALGGSLDREVLLGP